MTAAPEAGRPHGRPGLGLLRVGTGQAAGFADFGGTNQAYLGSLAPLLGFLIVLALVVGVSRRPVLGLAFFLSTLSDLLAPVVIADLLCGLWHRRRAWARYANVLNCAQWLMLAVLLLLLAIGNVGVAIGIGANACSFAVIVLFCAYVVWFHWFAARHVLAISRGRAALATLAIVFGTGLLLQAPPFVARLAGFTSAVPDMPWPPADEAGH